MNRFILVGLMALSSFAGAEVAVITDNNKHITLSVTESYTLGTNDTISSALDVNLETAKKAASEFAGSYVESEMKVIDSKITKQQVRIVSAGYLEVISNDNKRALDKQGNIVLDSKIKIRISKQSIKDGIEKLKNDPAKTAKIKELEKRNKLLNKELLNITNKLSDGVSRTDLLKARSVILSELNDNRSAAKKVFEQGTLFQLAQLDDSEFELAKRVIDDHVYGYIQNEIDITVGKPSFVKNRKGNFDIIFPVDYIFDHKPLEKVLSEYFVYEREYDWGRQKNVFDISSVRSDEVPTKAYTNKLIQYLVRKIAVIEIDTGYGKGYLHVTEAWNRSYLIKMDSKDSEPKQKTITIENVTEENLKKISEISTKLIVDSPLSFK